MLPIVPEEKIGEFHSLKEQLISGRNLAGIELVRMNKHGDAIDVSLWSAPIYDGNREIIGFISFTEDIRKRKAAENMLKRNLEEKQVLLREIHHRVKNNLSVISSLLNLQSSTITNPEEAIEAFKNSRDRIMAMALVHMELYESCDFTHIDMGTYLSNLTKQIAFVNESAGRVSLHCHVDNVILDLQVAVPCGLILNELITNAYKYAYPSGEEGSIEVSIKHSREDLFEMSIVDNGHGLPEGYINTETLGLTLVKLLVTQINGTMDIQSEGNGTSIRIFFSDEAAIHDRMADNPGQRN